MVEKGENGNGNGNGNGNVCVHIDMTLTFEVNIHLQSLPSSLPPFLPSSPHPKALSSAPPPGIA